MADFFTPTNKARVEKMVATIEMLAKSARSNKASAQDFNELLDPLTQAIADLQRELGGSLASPAEQVSSDPGDITDRSKAIRTAPDGTPRAPGPNGSSMQEYKPLWVSVVEMSEKAPLDDLGQAVIVYAKRLEDMMFTIQDHDESLVKENKTSVPEPDIEPDIEDEDDDDAWG